MENMENKDVRTIPIADIHCDKTRVQARSAMNEQTVKEYEEAMKSGAKFPPVDIFLVEDRYILSEGFHRVEAAKRAGRTDIDARAHEGTLRDAVLFAVGANATHGLRRTNKDKRRAVEILLKDEEWCEWSNVRMAKLCAVSDELVRKLRSSLPTVGSDGVRRFKTKHGNESTMQTGNIGKPSVQAGEVGGAPPSEDDTQTITSPMESDESIQHTQPDSPEPENLFGVLYADFCLIDNHPIPATENAVVFLRVSPLKVCEAIKMVEAQGFTYEDQAVLVDETGRSIDRYLKGENPSKKNYRQMVEYGLL